MTILLAFTLLAQSVAAGSPLNPAEFPKIKQLAPGVYVWSDVHPSGLYTTNDLIVVTSDGVLVADGQKDADTTRKMVEGIARITPKPITVVVVGSEHGDHTGGNAAFPSSATYVKSPLLEGKLKTLKIGGVEIQILDRGRAHTGTDLEVYLPKEKILFTSEAYSHHIFPNMRAAVPSEWIQTVKSLRTLDITTAIPGHGFIEDGATMKASLADFEKALTYIVTEATRLHEAGVPAEAAAKQANWGPYAEWTAADRNGPVAIQRVYDAIDGKIK